MNMRELQYTGLLFFVFFLFLTIPLTPGSPLSIFRNDAPVGQWGGETVTRGDVMDTMQLLSLASFIVVFWIMTLRTMGMKKVAR